MESWRVIEANHPKVAKTSINRLGFEVFMPECVVRIRHARRSELVRRPLLYNYIFARFDPDGERWKLIPTCRGVEHVMAGRVSDQEFARVHELADKFDGVVCEQIPLTKGQVVLIIDGAMAGHLGTISIVEDGKPNVAVDCRLFGAIVPVIVARGSLAPAA